MFCRQLFRPVGGRSSPTASLFLSSLPVSFLAALSLLLAQGLLGIPQAEAQEWTDLEKTGPRWSFAILTALAGPGPTGDFADALTRAGYDETKVGSLFSSSSELHYYPREPSFRTGFEFEVGYSLSPLMALALSVGKTDFGGTTGYKDLTDEGGLWAYPTYTATLNHLSPALIYRISGIRASLGPSLVQVRTWTENGGRNKDTTMRIGAAAGVAFSQEVWNPLSLEFRAQYRLFGSVDMDRYELESGDIPEFSAASNYWQISFGFGFHLGE